MESFSQKVTQESNVKSEVSDVALQNTCELSDDESLSKSSPNDSKSSYDDQESLLDSNGGGSPLPPRKRAKTQEEKEQRRIERIMRNRQAAHASREKKRKHLETLEGRCTELETENLQLRSALSDHNRLKARLERLEAAVKVAKTSGNLSSLEILDSAIPSLSNELQPMPGTVTGTIAGSSQLPEPKTPENSQALGSPTPSLEDDCASPEALYIKNEDDFFPSYAMETPSEPLDDPFSLMNFSFETNPASAGIQAPESSSKSRHPAALTQLPAESWLAHPAVSEN